MSWRRAIAALVAVAVLSAVGAGVAGGYGLIAQARGGGERASTVGTASLVVRAKNGRVVTRRALKAALSPAAGATLAELFSGKYVRGAWGVAGGLLLGGSTIPGGGTIPPPNQLLGPCTAPGQLQSPCLSVEPAWASGATNASPSLTLAVPSSGADADKLVLTGTLDANGQGLINMLVASMELTCADGSCAKAPMPLVQASLSSPVSVSPGQKVLVKFVVGIQ